MRAAGAGICAFLLPVVVIAGVPQRFVDPEGRFEVFLGGEPDHGVTTIKTPWGDTEGHGFAVKELTGSMLISYWDYPATAPPKEAIESAIDATIRASRSQPRLTRSTKINGLQGVELVIDLQTGSVLRTRLFLVGRRLYKVAVVSKTDAFSERAESFFASFRTPPRSAPDR
jgi:hypothetical protein